ncbi:DMT family transporter [Paenibacillus rigui]|uniref:QacE family quaternary ammonium compound efflux SMR transporter n=1 Tax=Paenibacillus rigui TaxID=554312 RepID=A0A229UNA1_9BACL|nr:multidrug efflux SMR transporter [Paenibacillus rigui]OXM84852.1 QacE family quaternary ammonium compound efflux SMR transporter [Paenibacillus rigui]
MAWIYVVIGGLMDVGWATGLAMTDGFTKLVPSLLTLTCIVLSFYLYALSLKNLPVGTAYAVFTGIGAAGTVIVGMLFLGEPKDALRLLFIALLVGGLLGLKLVTPKEESTPTSKSQREA